MKFMNNNFIFALVCKTRASLNLISVSGAESLESLYTFVRIHGNASNNFAGNLPTNRQIAIFFGDPSKGVTKDKSN